MAKKDFSIVVPHYNNTVGVSKLLRSIPPNDEIEIIIVDDKSTEKEKEQLSILVKKYSGRIKIFENTTAQKGAGVCRNIALDYVNSNWVLFADSDDHFIDGFLSNIDIYKSSEYDIVYFFPTSQNELGETLSRHNTFLEPMKKFIQSNDSENLKYRITVVWSKLYRTSFLKENRLQFDSTIVSNDVLFAIKADYYASRISVDQSPIYSWDLNSESLTTKMSKERFDVVIDVFIRKNAFLRQKLEKDASILREMSAFKPIMFSLIRYKFGLKYTLSLINRMRKAGIPLINYNDFNYRRFLRGVKNNFMYKMGN